MTRLGFFLACCALLAVVLLPFTAAETNNATERMSSLTGFLKDYTTVIDVAQQQVSTTVAAQMREWRAEQQAWQARLEGLQSKQENQQQLWQSQQQLLLQKWQLEQQRTIDEMHNFPLTLAKAALVPVMGLLGTFLTWVFRDALGSVGKAVVAGIGIGTQQLAASQQQPAVGQQQPAAGQQQPTAGQQQPAAGR